MKNNFGKADLHIHTSYSYDGISSPYDVVVYASKIGLDVIAICDHDEIKGAKEAETYSKKYGVDVIVGEEILTSEGEVLALFIKEKVNPGKTLFATVKEIKKQNGLVVIPHPFSLFPMTRPPVSVKQLYSLFKEDKFLPDGLEVLNSMPAGRMSSKKSQRLNKKVFSVAEVAGSDAHITTHIGMCQTLFPGKNKEDLRKAILQKKTSVIGQFGTRKETAEYLRKNIAKMGKRAKGKITKPYDKIKRSINNHFNSSK